MPKTEWSNFGGVQSTMRLCVRHFSFLCLAHPHLPAVPLVDVADLGPVVKAILANPDRWVGVEIPVVGDVLTIPQVAEAYSEITGQPARAVFVEHVEQEKIPQWIARHRGYKEAGYFPKYIGREEDIPVLARQLYPGIKSFRQWLRETGFDATRV